MLRFLNYTFSKKNKNILAFLVQNTHYLSSKIIIALNFKKIAILPPPPKKKNSENNIGPCCPDARSVICMKNLKLSHQQ
jgi:hypothetical protein